MTDTDVIETIADTLAANAGMPWDRHHGDPDCVYAVEAARFVDSLRSDDKLARAVARALPTTYREGPTRP